MPPLESERLLIRPFALADLEAIHHILDVELAAVDFGNAGANTLEERRRWLQWTVWGYEELARLYQPPYGERAIVLRATGECIGACGFVPCLAPFGQIPALRTADQTAEQRFNTPEFGLYYAVTPRHQRRGHATGAARALTRYAFEELGVRRIVATTTYDNGPSMGVMRKLGMEVANNPLPTPPWLQVVGVARNPAIPLDTPGTP